MAGFHLPGDPYFPDQGNASWIEEEAIEEDPEEDLEEDPEEEPEEEEEEDDDVEIEMFEDESEEEPEVFNPLTSRGYLQTAGGTTGLNPVGQQQSKGGAVNSAIGHLMATNEVTMTLVTGDRLTELSPL
ncbi:hypothetical protein Lser_V15G05628 [Lactuca serriola]